MTMPHAPRSCTTPEKKKKKEIMANTSPFLANPSGIRSLLWQRI